MAEHEEGSGLEDTLSSPDTLPRRTHLPTATPSTLLGRYVLFEPLGAGGGGVVFRAFDRDLGRAVAIKLLHPSAHARSTAASIRLRREAQANARLQHPNVVSVFDVGEHEGDVFVAMELVDGGSLKDWLDTPRPVREILEVFAGAGEGLAAAHANGIVHRDFKPANVLLGRDGRPRVADFGLARALAEPETDEADPEPSLDPGTLLNTALTRTGSILGTPAYMAPEQRLGRPADARADQFAFCLCLVEALTGTRPPLRDEGWDPKTWLKSHRLPSRLAEALLRGLSTDPEDRFSSLAPVLEAMRAELGARKRQRAFRFFVLAVLLLPALVWLLDRPVCEGLDAPLTSVWDDDLRRRLAASLPDGPAAGWSVVLAALDRHAARWIDARTQVCAATRIRGEQSEELLDARMTCLDRSLESFRILLALFERGRIPSSEAGSEAVLRLMSPEACVTTTVKSPRPNGNKAPSALSAAVEQGFSELEVSFAAGLYAEGLERAREVLELADQSGDLEARARALAWLARLHDAADRAKEAAWTWERAAMLADAAGDDEARLEAYLALVRLDQGMTDTAKEADRNTAQAEAVVTRLAAGSRWQAALLGAKSQLALRRGDLVGCHEHGEQAWLHLEQAPDSPMLERLQISEDLATCLERLGLRKRAAEVIASALAFAERALGPRHPRVGRLFAELSRALDFSGDPIGAEKAARRAIEISEATLGEQHSATAAAHQALANVLARAGHAAPALRHYRRALAIAVEVHGPSAHQIGILHSAIGLLLTSQGDFDAADQAHRNALSILETALGARHPETAAAWGRLAHNLAQRGDCEAALPHFRRALGNLRASNPLHARLLDQVRGIASCLTKLGRPLDAVPILEEGLEVLARRDEPPAYAARLELMAAQAFFSAGRRQEARALAAAAERRLETETSSDAALLEEIRAWRAENPP